MFIGTQLTFDLFGFDLGTGLLREETNKDYLHIAGTELIKTLVRERKSSIYGPDIKIAELFSESAILNNKAKGLGELSTYIIRCLMNKVRDLIIDGISENGYEMLSELRDMVGENVISNYIDSLSYGVDNASIIAYHSNDSRYFTSKFRVLDSIEDWSVGALKPSMQGQVRYFKADRREVKEGHREFTHYINDVALLYARAIMYNAIDSYIKALDEDERENDVLYNHLLDDVRSELSGIACGVDNKVIYTDESVTALEFVQNLINLGIDVQIGYLEDIPLNDRDAVRKRLLTESVISGERRGLMYNFVCMDLLGVRSTFIKYYAGGSGKSNGGAVLRSEIADRYLAKYLVIILEKEYENRIIRKYEKDNCSTYAHSYEEKKNIPAKVRTAMENSEFLKTFGYVEFDEECDVAKVEELFLEWKPLAAMLIEGKMKDVSLRFRKLGHHKAAGLYYPSMSCICVDIRHPDSFAHEVFHMLDYKSGCISRQYDFENVITHYKRAFERELAACKVKLSGKYNKSYYFVPTEIFARCGEIYLTRILGICNSLVKPDEETGFAYPCDDALERAIENYFGKIVNKDGLFDVIFNGAE